ncbi:prophage side tail fiber protein homolog StfR-like [Haliotis asinina]|uniref:prophage side tail fiber protein homolog StfR-like n=1 Tax=Haliotis asinina TaxID=109174 RepID=UPI003531EF97
MSDVIYLPATVAKSCEDCKSDYTTAKGSAADDTAKCAALATYVTCLETSVKTDAGCPLAAADAAAIETDYSDATCSTDSKFTATCICQKDFWKTDQSTGATAVCSAAKAYILCLKGKTAAACDMSASVVDLATGVEARMTGLGTTDCAISDSCQCQINTAKATIDSNANKCTAYNTELSCLRTAQAAGCDGSTTKRAVATATDTARAGLPSGDCAAPTATCQCEINAAKGDAASATSYCTVLSTLKTCLSAITTGTEAGCTTGSTQAALVTDTEAKTATAKCGNAADHVTFALTSLIVSVLMHVFL